MSASSTSAASLFFASAISAAYSPRPCADGCSASKSRQPGLDPDAEQRVPEGLVLLGRAEQQRPGGSPRRAPAGTRQRGPFSARRA
eukprot:11746117-Alexandrium_andersonii.AAC.1